MYIAQYTLKCSKVFRIEMSMVFACLICIFTAYCYFTLQFYDCQSPIVLATLALKDAEK